MIDVSRTLIIIAICALITLFERAFPFLLFRNGKVPGYIRYLGKVLGPAIMTTLVFYCLRNISFGSAAEYAPQLIAAAVTVGLHLRKKNSLISILGGTVCCMILTQMMV